jgi:hypothetical protein
MFLLIALHGELDARARLRHMLAAFVPLGVTAVMYLAGRLEWLQLAGTGGTAPWPSIADYSWPLAILAMAGLAMLLVQRRGRAAVLMVASIAAQAAAFYVLARRAHADRPYMALKMFYLLLWPMAACAAVALGALWTAAAGVAERIGRRPVPRRTLDRAAWVLVLGVLFVAARPLARAPRRLHPLPPAVSAPLYEAGLWARANLPAGCIEYLVGDDETAYWLHLAVLGNPRVSARTGDNSTYEPTDAIVRWLTPAGLPYAIADLTALPTDVRNELDIVQPFGSAAVARRRGPSSCAADVR